MKTNEYKYLIDIDGKGYSFILEVGKTIETTLNDRVYRLTARKPIEHPTTTHTGCGFVAVDCVGGRFLEQIHTIAKL